MNGLSRNVAQLRSHIRKRVLVAAFPGRALHDVLDNLNTYKQCDPWLKKHPNVYFHFTPTRLSWLNRID
jgi:hypothetical protein